MGFEPIIRVQIKGIHRADISAYASDKKPQDEKKTDSESKFWRHADWRLSIVFCARAILLLSREELVECAFPRICSKIESMIREVSRISRWDSGSGAFSTIER